ncbi:hypothetical protein DRQ17_06545, partial [bacterium]
PHKARHISREITQLTSTIAQLKNQIKQILFNTFNGLEYHCNVTSIKMLKLLTLIPSAHVASSLSTSQIQSRINQTFAGKGKNPDITPEILKNIASSHFSINDPVKDQILISKISILLTLIQQVKTLKTSLIHMVKSSNPTHFSIINSIKGIGDYETAAFISEINSINNFPSYKKIIAYAGIDPVPKDSGKFKGKRHISKKGNKYLRKLIFLMATNAAHYSHPFEYFYSLKRSQGNSHKKAVIATAHKLIRVIFAMVNNNLLFSETALCMDSHIPF